MAQPQLIEYQVADDNTVYRVQGDEKTAVATYDPTTGLVAMIETRYRVAVIRHLREKGLKYEGLAEEKDIFEKESRKEIPPRPKKNPRLGDKTPALVEWYARYDKAAFIAKYGVRELQIRTSVDRVENKIRNEEGKLVTVVEDVPVYERSGDDVASYDVDRVKRGEQRLLAERSTTLTVRINEADSGQEYDWDAE